MEDVETVSEADLHAQPERRDPTGVSRLDDILGGGLPPASLTLIMGLPGSGKTTIACQIAFTAAKSGKTALILTALSESTSKMISHLRAFSFFDENLIGGPVQFLSLQSALSQGLEAVSASIITAARRVKADIVLLDGFRGMRSVDANPQAAREFLYTIGTTLSTFGATTLVTSEADPRDPSFFPETTTADVIIGLHYVLLGVRQFRGIEVIKVRTSAPMPGLHALTLSSAGASVYPQLEERTSFDLLGGDAQTQGAASLSAEPAYKATRTVQRAGFDLAELDTMLAGGIPNATCTLLAGSLGSGKTLLAMYYSLAGVRAGEHVVYIGFRESREQLLQAAASFEIGPALERAMQPGGNMTFLEVPPIKINADILADRILNLLDQTRAKRLIVDSIAELERSILRSADPNRLEDYLAALLRALRVRGVTALLIKETDKALAASLDFSADPLSVMAENVLLLQQVAHRGELHRILTVLKLRFSDHDARLREFRIVSPGGLRVMGRLESEAGTLEGIAANQESQANQTFRQSNRRARRQTGRTSGNE